MFNVYKALYQIPFEKISQEQRNNKNYMRYYNIYNHEELINGLRQERQKQFQKLVEEKKRIQFVGGALFPVIL